MNTITLTFVLLVVYQIKHILADYFLQTEFMLGKFKPGWEFLGPLGAHVGVHAACTAIIMVVIGVPQIALPIALFDATVHFFMDRIKAGPKYMGRWKPLTGPQYMECKKDVSVYYDGIRFPTWDAYVKATDAEKKLRGNRLFWIALGLDQAIHHLTHYACIAFALHALGRL